jgi:hypothetical protein
MWIKPVIQPNHPKTLERKTIHTWITNFPIGKTNSDQAHCAEKKALKTGFRET